MIKFQFLGILFCVPSQKSCWIAGTMLMMIWNVPITQHKDEKWKKEKYSRPDGNSWWTNSRGTAREMDQLLYESSSGCNERVCVYIINAARGNEREIEKKKTMYVFFCCCCCCCCWRTFVRSFLWCNRGHSRWDIPGVIVMSIPQSHEELPLCFP